MRESIFRGCISKYCKDIKRNTILHETGHLRWPHPSWTSGPAFWSSRTPTISSSRIPNSRLQILPSSILFRRLMFCSIVEILRVSANSREMLFLEIFKQQGQSEFINWLLLYNLARLCKLLSQVPNKLFRIMLSISWDVCRWAFAVWMYHGICSREINHEFWLPMLNDRERHGIFYLITHTPNVLELTVFPYSEGRLNGV